MEISKLRMGVIGLGFMGKIHARLFTELPTTELVAVADIDQTQCSAIVKQYGVEGYDDYNEMLKRSELDAVSICVSDRLHTEPAIAAAKMGKAILLEKPMAHSGKAASAIKSAVDEYGIPLMVAHVLRFDPKYVQVHDMIARGEIGEIIHLRAKRNSIRELAFRLGESSSILYYMGVHDVDMFRWCAQSEITQVYAQKVAKLPTGNENSLFAVLNFSNGAIGLLDYSWAWPNALPAGYYAALEVVGTKQGALLDVFDQGLHFIGESDVTQPDTHLWPEINGKIVGALRDELLHFSEAILAQKPFLQPIDDALKAVYVLDAIFKSIELNQPVQVENVS